jgi:hypothetical protein
MQIRQRKVKRWQEKSGSAENTPVNAQDDKENNAVAEVRVHDVAEALRSSRKPLRDVTPTRAARKTAAVEYPSAFTASLTEEKVEAPAAAVMSEDAAESEPAIGLAAEESSSEDAYRCPYNGCCKNADARPAPSIAPIQEGRSDAVVDPGHFLAPQNWREILLLVSIILLVTAMTCVCDLVVTSMFKPSNSANKLYERWYTRSDFLPSASTQSRWL